MSGNGSSLTAKALPGLALSTATVWQTANGNNKFPQLISPSNRYDEGFLAWQSVRQMDHCGFGGYFIGLEEPDIVGILTKMLDRHLDGLEKLYGKSFITALRCLVTEDCFELKTMTDFALMTRCATQLNSIMAGMLAQLSARNRTLEFETYRRTTHSKARAKCPIIYLDVTAPKPRHRYNLPNSVNHSALTSLGSQVATATDPETDLKAWLRLLGKAGHPIFREAFGRIKKQERFLDFTLLPTIH